MRSAEASGLLDPQAGGTLESSLLAFERRRRDTEGSVSSMDEAIDESSASPRLQSFDRSSGVDVDGP